MRAHWLPGATGMLFAGLLAVGLIAGCESRQAQPREVTEQVPVPTQLPENDGAPPSYTPVTPVYSPTPTPNPRTTPRRNLPPKVQVPLDPVRPAPDSPQRPKPRRR